MSKVLKYAAFIVGGAGTTVTALVPYYGNAHWFTGLVAGLTALYAWLVNQGAKTPPNPPTV